MRKVFFKKCLNITIFLFIFINLILNVYSTPSVLKINSPNYFNEQNNIYSDIHYLKNEFLSFDFCPNKNNIKNLEVTLNCGSNNLTKLKIFKNTNSGCFFSNYNLDSLSCNDFSLDINYNSNNKEKKIKRNFKKQKQSLLINHILNQDYTNLSPVDLSYYLLVSTDLEGKSSQKNLNIYNKLKNDRNNLNKCWPLSNCDISKTSTILKNLKSSGYDLKSRMLEDGNTYLSKNMVSNSNNPLKFTINITNTYFNNSMISCDLLIDNAPKKTFLFDGTNDFLTKYASNKVDFTCNQTIDNIKYTLYALDNSIKKTINVDAANSIIDSMTKFSCIGNNLVCNFDSTIKVLMTYKSTFPQAPLLESYIDSLVQTTGTTTKFNSLNEVLDTGKYLSYKKNDALFNNLKFIQNNDGSWGSGINENRILETSWAVLGLEKISNSEYVNDAKKWIYFNEPINGWGSIKKNSIAYLAIKEKIKPYLKIDSKSQINKTTTFIISNPTIYKLKDITLNFDSNLNDFLSYKQNLGDLSGGQQIQFNISINNKFYGKKSGNLILSGINGNNQKLALIKMPINILGPSAFKIINKINYSISSEKKFINLEIQKNINNFNMDCSYTNPFDKILNNIKINSNTTNIKIKDSQMVSGNVSFDIICKSSKNSLKFPINLNINLAKKSFEIKENSAQITSLNDFSINVQNLLTKKDILSFQIVGDLKNIVSPAEKNKVIAANDTREIFFTINNKNYFNNLNVTNNLNSQILITSSQTGFTSKIPIKINFLATPQSTGLSLWVYLLIGFLVLFAIFIIVGRYIRSNQNEEEYDEEMPEDEMYYDDNQMQFK